MYSVTNFSGHHKVDSNNNRKDKLSPTYCYEFGRLRHRRRMKKSNIKRRSGSSSDSAITLNNNFEDEDSDNSSESDEASDDFTEVILNFVCLALQDERLIDLSNGRRILEVIHRYYDISECELQNTFGFVVDSPECDKNRIYLEFILWKILDSRAKKFWYSSNESLKFLIREFGIPNELRSKIWLSFIQAKIGDLYNIPHLLHLANETALHSPSNEATIRQIDLDVHRTMPHHTLFTTDFDGTTKLRRILIAYSVHVNPIIGYCQAMNFIAALLLVIFDGNEEHSLKGLICIIDHYFPAHYFDQQLTGVRADQLLLRDLIVNRFHCDHKEVLNEQTLDEITNSVTLNWFLSLFHNAVPWQTRISILDCFWVEGVKVLFRFSLALLQFAKSSFSENHTTSGELVNLIRDKSRHCYDVNRLKKIAFNGIKIPKRKYLSTRRAFYVKQLSNELVSNSKECVETRKQWLRRKSFEVLHLSANEEKRVNFVASCDKSIIAVFDEKLNKKCVSVQIIGNCLQKTIHLTAKRRHKNLMLIGIKNDATKLVFTHQSGRPNYICDDSSVSIEMISVPFENTSGFYCEELDEVYIIGCHGIIAKVSLKDASTMETITIFNKRAKVTTAAFDCKEFLLWMYLSAENGSKAQLLVVDTKSLDVFNIIDIGSESVNRIRCSLGSAYVYGQTNDGLFTVSFVSSSFSKHIVSERDEIIDIQIYNSLNTNDTANVVVVLFRNGKLFWIETEGSCVQKKFSTFVDGHFGKSTLICNAIKEDDEHVVTIVTLDSSNSCINKRF